MSITVKAVSGGGGPRGAKDMKEEASSLYNGQWNNLHRQDRNNHLAAALMFSPPECGRMAGGEYKG